MSASLAIDPAWPEPMAFYAAHAADFASARCASTWVERPWLEMFAAQLPAGGTVLDLGCGTGAPIAAWLRGEGFDVTGVDGTRAFIDRARARHPQGAWIEADMRCLDLGRRFDGILAWDSFFHLAPDAQRDMFATFESHAAPGAALMFNSGTEHGEGTSYSFGDPLYHASLDTHDYRALLAAHGFVVLRHSVADPACGGRTISLAQKA